MTKSLRFSLWCLAATISINMTVGTGLITNWGNWYSASTPYRRQTEALLAGRFALSSSPTAIGYDMAWAEGGVQQVWGLGVPLWRLPFEVLARAFGQPAFPDRIVLAVAIMIVSYIVLRVFTVPDSVRDTGAWIKQLKVNPAGMIASLLLLAFPPIITMCRGPFNVYEEAVVYEYYYCVVLLAQAIAFVRGPLLHQYVLISLCAGFAGFIRPTASVYGIATVAIACVCTWRAGWKWWKSLLGPGLFCLGGTLLFWSNLQRFGSGFEFGHQLNFSALDLMYMLRFQAPFECESLWTATQELVGSIFFVNELNGFDVYRHDVVGWQSQTPRWRHFYGTTFDVSHLFAVIGCWLATLWGYSRTQRKDELRPSVEQVVLAAWSFISFVLLFGFYLHYCAMMSRYAVDFAAAISAAMAGSLLAVSSYRTRSKLLHCIPCMALCFAVVIWWVLEIAYAKNSFPSTPVFTQEQTLDEIEGRISEPKSFPKLYRGALDPLPTDISYNGLGWSHPYGETGSMVVLFVDGLRKLTLDVAPAFDANPSEVDYASIRAKVGLEHLPIESMQTTELGKRLTFAAPNCKAYRVGIQVVFLSTVGPADFRKKRSPFRLINVQWGDSNEESLPSTSSALINELPSPVRIVRAFPNLQFRRPICATFPPDGTNRLVVVTQTGEVYIFPNDQRTNEAKELISIRHKSSYKDAENEEGLLGFAFHPNFKQNGQFFLYYTTNDSPHTSVLARARISPGDLNKADPVSLEEIFRTPWKIYWNHNGGTIAFGPDGYLYIAIGDGGSWNDPNGYGQDITTIFAKVLRIDIDHTDIGKNYAVPMDNPFLNVPLAAPEIWALGLRNVWRMAFDRQTGKLWAGDVGQDTWEEINIIKGGGNYGWNLREGFQQFVATQKPPPGPAPKRRFGKTIDPIFAYHHALGKCIVGGCVYRGKQVPELYGAYLFADHVTGQVYALWHDDEVGRVTVVQTIGPRGMPVLSFAEDEAGEVYFMTTQGILHGFLSAAP